MSNDKNQKKGSLIPSGKREITEYSSDLISRGLELVKIVEEEQKGSLFPIKMDGKWGYINKIGKKVIKPQFDYAGRFSEGLAEVEIDNKCGYIDKMGKMVIKLQFDYAEDFSKGLAFVEVGNNWGYINKKGDYVWKPTS